MTNPISYIDIKLPIAPQTTNPELHKELLVIYNALHNLMASLSENYGASVAQADAIAIGSGGVFTMFSLNLPAGAWAVSGAIVYLPDATTRINVIQYSLATPAEVFHPFYRDTRIFNPPITIGAVPIGGGSVHRNIYLSTAGAINLAGYTDFDTAGMRVYGWLTAKRVAG